MSGKFRQSGLAGKEARSGGGTSAGESGGGSAVCALRVHAVGVRHEGGKASRLW